MGDNKAPGLEERILKEEKYRRLYWCGRFGSNAVLDDPFWTPWAHDKVPALHDHRSPYALCQPDYGIKEYREKRAAAAAAAVAESDERGKTPAPVVEPINTTPAVAAAALKPPASALRATPTDAPVARMLTGAQRSGTQGSVASVYGQMPRSASVALPSREASRRGSAAQGLPLSSSHSRLITGSDGRASKRSLRSRVSVASVRSKVAEAVQKEVARSELQAFYEAKEGKIQRERQAQLDMPVHLRSGPNPIDAGCLPNFLTEQMRSLQLPVKMATDPKWSTGLKRMNDKIGRRLEWERKMAAALSGSIIPEWKHMPPQDYKTNPPTPYFKPGEAEQARQR